VGNLVPFGISALNAMLVACACYLIGRVMTKKFGK